MDLLYVTKGYYNMKVALHRQTQLTWPHFVATPRSWWAYCHSKCCVLSGLDFEGWQLHCCQHRQGGRLEGIELLLTYMTTSTLSWWNAATVKGAPTLPLFVKGLRPWVIFYKTICWISFWCEVNERNIDSQLLLRIELRAPVSTLTTKLWHQSNHQPSHSCTLALHWFPVDARWHCNNHEKVLIWSFQG